MPQSEQEAHEGAASGVLLIVASSATLHETASFGGPLFLHGLVEQLLGHLGTYSLYTETSSTPVTAPNKGAVSWLCRLENKYYSAKIKAILVQQQEAAQEPLFRESPEAVIFICSHKEQQQLHAARRAMSKGCSHVDEEPEGFIEPPPFMKDTFFGWNGHQQGQEELDPCVQTPRGVTSSWWVRGVPLKFIISLHCNSSKTQQICCSNNNKSSSSSSSSSFNSGGETEVWILGGDVFFEGMELCFTNASSALDLTSSFIHSLLTQQNHRIKKVAEGLQCHMWPGLSRRTAGGSKASGEPRASKGSSDSECGLNESSDKCVSIATPNEEKEEEEKHPDNKKPEDGCWREKDSSGASPAEKNKPLCAVEDAEAFDALAAAMMDLKQKGSLVSSEDRRKTAMRLAAQLASLTMCDED
ncbi:hypothetical protein ACSSS7_005213 [Eimeria intestinalis]